MPLSPDERIESFKKDTAAFFLANNLDVKARRQLIAGMVRDHWGPLPVYSTLKAPVIEEVQKVTVGTGTVPFFREDGRLKVMLLQAGPHYKKAADKVLWTIPGGFVNFSYREGSSFILEDKNKPENARITGARETEEELQTNEGPLLSINPALLDPLDTDVIVLPWSETRLVMSLAMQMAAEEITVARHHIERLESDAAYRDGAAARTINDETGKPEVVGAKIFDVQDVIEGRVPLLNEDQASIFGLLEQRFGTYQRVLMRRTGPTRLYQQKVKDLAALTAQVEEWRRSKNTRIGITSGVFDLRHPGHDSFLSDAADNCSHLVVIIASDRTVAEQKGVDKPAFNEYKRAQAAASFEMVDGVIISDSLYHEDILKALRPDVMFKGDDYAGIEIKGAELVGCVELIPCAEKENNSSSVMLARIRDRGPDKAPNWAPKQ